MCLGSHEPNQRAAQVTTTSRTINRDQLGTAAVQFTQFLVSRSQCLRTDPYPVARVVQSLQVCPGPPEYPAAFTFRRIDGSQHVQIAGMRLDLFQLTFGQTRLCISRLTIFGSTQHTRYAIYPYPTSTQSKHDFCVRAAGKDVADT